MLRYEETSPAEPLKDYLECYWTLCGDSPMQEELSLPDGSASLMFNFGQPYQRALSQRSGNVVECGKCNLAHQGKYSVRITHPSPVRIVGVRFRPFGLAPFFRLSMSSLPTPFVIQGPDIESLIGHWWKDIWPARYLSDILPVVENHFLQMLSSASEPDKLVNEAVSIMVKKEGNIRITDLHEELCTSKSNLEKKFQEHVGLSPKLLCNILRFNAIVYRQQSPASLSLTELSYSQGFFDQAHLVHNFRSFTGLPPGRFFKRDNLLIEMLRQSYQTKRKGEAGE